MILPIGCMSVYGNYMSCIECQQEYNNEYCRLVHDGLGLTHVFEVNIDARFNY